MRSSGLKILLAHVKNSGTVAVTAIRNAAAMARRVSYFACVSGFCKKPA
jgi:hypothetical protein